MNIERSTEVMMMRNERRNRTGAARWRAPVLAAVAAGAAVLAGCSMDVDNPSQILDSDLDNVEAISALRAGVARDFAQATANNVGGAFLWGALLTDELTHVGTWVGMRSLSDGNVINDCAECDNWWEQPAQARWVANDALRRMNEILTEAGDDPGSSPAVAEVTMWAGHASRTMGDIMCEAVVDQQIAPYTTYYDEAVGHFQSAIDVATAAGEDDIALSAQLGLANVYMNMGDWDAAAAAAVDVPTDFVYYQVHNETAGVSNQFRWWTFERNETSIWGTPFATLGYNESAPEDGGDPRVTYDIAMEDGTPISGGDNRRPFYRQLKYGSYGTDIPVAKGTEARLIEAEAALVQDGDVGTVEMKINEVRAHYGLDPIDPLGSEQEAWEALMTERGIEFWLEGRRLPDMRRWARGEPGVDNIPFMVVRTDVSGEPASADPWEPVVTSANTWDERGDLCIKISETELNSWGSGG